MLIQDAVAAVMRNAGEGLRRLHWGTGNFLILVPSDTGDGLLIQHFRAGQKLTAWRLMATDLLARDWVWLDKTGKVSDP